MRQQLAWLFESWAALAVHEKGMQKGYVQYAGAVHSDWRLPALWIRLPATAVSTP
jgi:hypothetical protein